MENKLDIYNKAKEAYYTGNPIMGDIEFDELEQELGLSNKSYIGTSHNPSYTIKHPIIMGSLSKIQIKNENKNSDVNWEDYYNQIIDITKTKELIIMPKYDGCSFEAIIKDGNIEAISTRGDGEYGKNIYNHLISQVEKNIKDINKYIKDDYIIRGEVLINKKIYNKKYNDFANPRAFVAGILNRDYCTDIKNIVKDLSIVIYDIRVKDNNIYKDIDITNLSYTDYPIIYNTDNFSEDVLKEVYNKFDTYRNGDNFTLDGFVIKPIIKYRENNTTLIRPKDVIAVKFLPMLCETEVVNIEWSTGKTNELIPVVEFSPIKLDGKIITRASGHNYGNLIDKKISIGTKIIISLAGDIIPFIYSITDTTNWDINKLNIPDCNTYIEDCHLYKRLSGTELKQKMFLNSINALEIPNIGPANANKLFEYICDNYKGDEFFGIEEREIPDNILLLTDIEIERGIGGKIGSTVSKNFAKILSNITISYIIKSMSIDDCGPKVAEAIEKWFLNKYDDDNFKGLSSKAYNWIFDNNSDTYKYFQKILNHLNKSIEDFREVELYKSSEDNTDKIPVILTGEPNNYKSKSEFLQCNKQYRLTTSWKECQIVFTNSLTSTTGKMKKALEKNIKIELY